MEVQQRSRRMRKCACKKSTKNEIKNCKLSEKMREQDGENCTKINQNKEIIKIIQLRKEKTEIVKI